MEYHQITLNEYLDLKQKIADELNSISNSFIKTGYYLKRIRDTEAYKQDGYESLSAFAQAVYGLSESTTSRFIAINTKFSVDGNTPLLVEDFKNFGNSKLSEMLTLSDEDIKLIKETTTVATIREIKKFNKQEPEVVEEHTATVESRVNTQPVDDFNKVIIEFFREEKELLDEVWQQSTEEEIAEVVNPSGNRTYKKGLYMLLFYEHKDGLALKKFGQAQAQTYTYYDFMTAMVDIYKDYYEDGKSVHEAYYGVPKKVESVPKKAESVPEKIENVQIEVVPGVEVEIIDIEKATEAAVAEQAKTEILAINEIATSQVNTQLAEEKDEEKVIKIIKKPEGFEITQDKEVIMQTNTWDDVVSKVNGCILKETVLERKVCEITFRKE